MDASKTLLFTVSDIFDHSLITKEYILGTIATLIGCLDVGIMFCKYGIWIVKTDNSLVRVQKSRNHFFSFCGEKTVLFRYFQFCITEIDILLKGFSWVHPLNGCLDVGISKYGIWIVPADFSSTIQ